MRKSGYVQMLLFFRIRADIHLRSYTYGVQALVQTCAHVKMCTRLHDLSFTHLQIQTPTYAL